MSYLSQKKFRRGGYLRSNTLKPVKHSEDVASQIASIEAEIKTMTKERDAYDQERRDMQARNTELIKQSNELSVQIILKESEINRLKNPARKEISENG